MLLVGSSRPVCQSIGGGKRSGTSGSKIGHAHLTGAFAEAAGLCLRENPAAQQCLARLAHNHSKGQALTSWLIHGHGRSTPWDKRQTAVDLGPMPAGEGRGAGALHASRDSQGMHRLHNAH